ncbi:MAG: hypothetical protein LIO69_09295 [Oscillospiraceae bacterium]|nr:hypothetical protein [Oscillospiraceae bacterium]
MDNIIIEKIWQDDLMFEILITSYSKNAIISSCGYVTNDFIEEESAKILDFLKGDIFECNIDLGIEADDVIAFHSKIQKDKAGHIILDITQVLNDDANPIHTCSCFIKTEFGILENFIKKLLFLPKAEIGDKISLL